MPLNVFSRRLPLPGMPTRRFAHRPIAAFRPRQKRAKKLAEEAIEVVIDAVDGEREAVIRESADLLDNLVVLWVALACRERLLGIAEKLPKDAAKGAGPLRRRKVVTPEAGRNGAR
jgi:phosphoribosyl-ATP pyrophosphohydrolase